MRKINITLILLFAVLVLSFVCRAEATSNTFVVEPMKEETEAIPIELHSSLPTEVSGNVVAYGGVIDFYVESPSGSILQHYVRILSNRFTFNALENGTYLVHIINDWSSQNVTVTVNYGLNRVVTITLQTKTVSSFTVTTETPSISMRPPIIDILKLIAQIFSEAMELFKDVVEPFGIIHLFTASMILLELKRLKDYSGVVKAKYQSVIESEENIPVNQPF